MSRLLKHLRPDTIVVQMTGLVVVSLFLAITITSLITWYQFSQINRADERPNPAARTGEIVAISRLALDAKSDEDLARTVSAGKRLGLNVQIMPMAQLTRIEDKPDKPAQPNAANFIRRAVSRAMRSDMVVLDSLGPDANSRDAIVIKLSDQNALVFRVAPNPFPVRRRPFFFGPSAILVATSAIFLTLIAIYALRRITSPLTSFSRAAEAFGQSLSSDHPLPEKGPREIAQAARALNVMRMRVRALVQERSCMLAAIGHDLRTPVTRLVLYAEKLPPSATREKILANLARVHDMLSETLAYATGFGESEQLDCIDLPSLLMTVCADFTDTVQPVRYIGEGRFAYICRPRSLIRAITNIVENATRAGTDVTVSLSASRFSGAQIEIADNGPGIPNEVRAQVFEPFFRADNARSSLQHGGLGLGLTIARDIIKNHGGEIVLLDNAPKGLIVRIKLPPERPEAPEPQSRVREEAMPDPVI